MRCESRLCFESEFIQVLYNWQTLVGAAFALLGALLLWKQIQHAREVEENRRARRFAAARATLPHILSEIINYLESSMEWMGSSHADARESKPLADPPAFPVTVIDSLERMIEATSVDAAAKACTALLRELQTFRSRIQSVARANRRPNNVRVGLHLELENYMIQAADIHRRVELLYPFARAEHDQVPEQTQETYVFKSLSLLGCSEAGFRNVFERANEIDKKRLTAAQGTKAEGPEPASTKEA